MRFAPGSAALWDWRNRVPFEAADQQIDRLVYKLYGLTEEEIRIVEGG